MMKEASATLKICVNPGTVCVRITGRATFAITCDFQNLIQSHLAKGNRLFVLDLGSCLTMDSTFLGTLAALESPEPCSCSCAPAHGPATFQLVRPSERILSQLDNLALMDSFKVLETADFPEEQFHDVPLNLEPICKSDLIKASLQAHRTLMAVHETNVPKFATVVSMLEEDLKNQQNQPK